MFCVSLVFPTPPPSKDSPLHRDLFKVCCIWRFSTKNDCLLTLADSCRQESWGERARVWQRLKASGKTRELRRLACCEDFDSKIEQMTRNRLWSSNWDETHLDTCSVASVYIPQECNSFITPWHFCDIQDLQRVLLTLVKHKSAGGDEAAVDFKRSNCYWSGKRLRGCEMGLRWDKRLWFHGKEFGRYRM